MEDDAEDSAVQNSKDRVDKQKSPKKKKRYSKKKLSDTQWESNSNTVAEELVSLEKELESSELADGYDG